MYKLYIMVYKLIYLLYLTTTTNSLYCNEHNSCSTKITVTTSETHRFTSKLPTWFEPCNCDQHCYAFGDCCLDAPSLASNPLTDWSTLSVKVNPKFIYTILMKTKCPSDWSNRKVRQMCENIGFTEQEDFLLPEFGHLMSLNNDEFLLWHVTSKTSQITYRNIYCAVCNNETHVESWSQRMRCIKTKDGDQCSPVYYSTAPDFMIREKVIRKPVQGQISSTCNIGWYKTSIKLNSSLTLQTIKNCARFYAPVVVQDRALQTLTAFKNEFCAICSGYQESQIICPVDSEQHFQHQAPTHFNSYSTFDANFITGGKIPDKNESCPPGNIYNPFDKKCRLILISDDDKDSSDGNMLNDENDDDMNKDMNETLSSDAHNSLTAETNDLEPKESEEFQEFISDSYSHSTKANELSAYCFLLLLLLY